MKKTILTVLAAALATAACSTPTDDAADTPDLEYGAFDVCQQFVKKELKSPSTAEFRNYFEDDGEVRVAGSGTGPYTVLSTVDSQNGFGAQVRSSFSCTVNHVGGDTWRLADISVF